MKEHCQTSFNYKLVLAFHSSILLHGVPGQKINEKLVQLKVLKNKLIGIIHHNYFYIYLHFPFKLIIFNEPWNARNHHKNLNFFSRYIAICNKQSSIGVA